MSWLTRLLGIKSDAEIAAEVRREPAAGKGLKALRRARHLIGDADGMLAEAEELEADRLARRVRA